MISTTTLRVSLIGCFSFLFLLAQQSSAQTSLGDRASLYRDMIKRYLALKRESRDTAFYIFDESGALSSDTAGLPPVLSYRELRASSRGKGISVRSLMPMEIDGECVVVSLARFSVYSKKKMTYFENSLESFLAYYYFDPNRQQWIFRKAVFGGCAVWETITD